jgi:hypothetical protein
MFIEEITMKSIDSCLSKEKEENSMMGSVELSQSRVMGYFVGGGVKKLTDAYHTSWRNW